MRILVRWIKITFVFVYIFVFLSLIALEVWSRLVGLSFFTPSLFYWLILIGWVFLAWNFKWRSSTSMISALILFIFAASFTTLGFQDLGETIMRFSFIGWMIGIIQALIEYRIVNGKK